MLIRTIGILAVLVGTSAGCKKDGGGSGGSGRGKTAEYKHDNPNFKVSFPADLEVGKVKTEGGQENLSIVSGDFSREVFLVWAPTGSEYDPEGPWSTYGHEKDHVKTLSEGTLPGGGKYIVNDRGARIYMHAVMSTKGYGVLCMASTSTKEPDMALLESCKTLAAW